MNEPYAPGTVVARKYRVERVLGRGGMGVVVAARRVHLGDLVAMKILLPGYGKSPDLVARFLREGRAAARLRSERVARVFDVDTLEDGVPYMVMELLEGEALDAKLAASGPLPVPQAVELVLQACEALAEAHTMGVIHRDLKPSNLFVVTGPDGTPCIKLLDFGISKVREATIEAPLTSADGIVGSPGYMSPEQIANASDVDARTDIWALGVIVHELVAGRRPFVADGLTSLLMRIVSEPPPDLSEAAPGTPAWLARTVARCLRKRADERFADVAELAAALAELGSAEAARSVARIAHAVEAARQRAVPNPPVASPAPDAPPTVASAEMPETSSTSDALTKAFRSGATPAGALRGRPGESAGGRPRGAIDPRSSQTLMAALKGHHLTIKLTAKQIGVALESQDGPAAGALFARLRDVLETHVRLEDARLYPELRQLAEQSRDADMVALVADFSTGMSEIGAVLTSFFEHFGDAKDLEGALAEWPDVCDALFSRLSAEEMSLYPLHRDLAVGRQRG